MGERRIINGAIYEKTPNGIVYVGPAQAAASAAPSAIPLPVNPVRAAREAQDDARKAEDQQLQRDAADRAERAAERADRTAQRQAAAAERTAAAATKPTEFQSKSAGFLGRMMQAERDFGAVPEDDRGGRSLPRQALHDILPGVENTLVNSADRQKADQAVENFIAASLRQESGASISPAEFDRQYNIFFPAPGDSPEVLTQKANARRQAIEGFRIAAGPLADAAAGTAQQQTDNEVPDGPMQSAASGSLNPFASDGGSRTTFDARTSAQIDAMINAGASKAMIDAVLKRQNFPTINAGDLARAKQWMKDNPGKKYYGANISRTEDLNFGQRVAGSAPGAFVAQMANTATAGIPAALAGEQGQGALDAMAALHPDASVAGNVVGGVTGAMGAEAAIAARAPAALARYAPRIADTLYGGLLGFNTAREGEGLQGAALGATGGLVGGAVGDRLVRGVGSAVRGVSDPAVQFLRNRNIPLTVGQAVGNSGRFGAGIKKIEDALTSIPFVGNMVDARRMEGLGAFNREAFNAAAPPGAVITETGAGGMGQIRDAVSDAYGRALDPVTLDVAGDTALPEALSAAQLRAHAIPQVGDDAAEALTFRVDGGMDANGLMSGRDFQEAYRGLGRDGRAAANGSYANEFAGVTREGQDALGEALERQNPGAFNGFLEANAANRRANVLADALGAAKSQTDELFTPAQLNRVDASSTSRLTDKINSASGNRPFYDLATNGQSVLPSKLPDSGTTTRALTGLALGGGAGAGGYLAGDTGTGAGVGLGLGATLLLAAGGSRPAQRAMVDILASRPDIARQIGTQIANNSGVGGWTGAGILAPMFAGQ